MFAAPRVVQDLAVALGGGFYVSDWTRNHANFFRSIEMTKSMMFVILLLVVAVAAFNIVAALVMVVKEKRADIAILRTLGASPASVMQVFVVQGAVIGVVGTLVGLVAGVATAFHVGTIVPAIENLFNVKFLAKDVYLIPDLPSDVADNAAALDRTLPGIRRETVLAALLLELSRTYARYVREGFAGLREDWCQRDAYAGHSVELVGEGERQSGICRGVDIDGALLLEQGTQRTRIIAGEISLRPRFEASS